MQIQPIFPQAVLGLTKLNVDSNKIQKYLENIEFELTNSTKEGNALCFMSKNKNVFEKIPFLKNEIYTQVKHYLNNVMQFKMGFQFTTSWVTKTEPNGYSQKHSHSNSFLSGVYYPKGNKNFILKFLKKTSFWNIKTIENNLLNAEWYTFNINENNVLILFPSDLEHSIEKNLSEENRYSLAFNILPLGEIGSEDSKINFK
jgi:uncharacterized protein (TIGR02466 family)